MKAMIKLEPSIYLGRVYTPLLHGGWIDIPDGALVVGQDGLIEAVGEKSYIQSNYAQYKVVDYSSYFIIPGLIDCHQHLCHYEWVKLIPNLLEWLKAIYRIEIKFKDVDYAQKISNLFFNELIKNGTTTCCVHGPYYFEATDIAFEEAKRVGIRLIMGMNAGDKNLPTELSFRAGESINRSNELFDKWDNASDGLLHYCFTVRPGYCSTEELLSSTAIEANKRAARIQSHLAEDEEGLNILLSDFNNDESDTQLYHRLNLLGSKTIMAHGIYLNDNDIDILSQTETAIVHCPRANLLAGGRQMDYSELIKNNIRVGLGSDLGAMKDLSMFRVMEDALKVNHVLSIHELFKFATIDGADSLSLKEHTGSLEIGKDADFIIIDIKALPREFFNNKSDIEDVLYSVVFKGHESIISSVFVKGIQLKTLSS